LIIETPRLRLRPWRDADRDAFAALNADPEVARDLGGPLSRAASDAKLGRYIAAFDRHGFCRWAIETRAGDLVGYAGVMPVGADHPLGPHHEVGWRLKRDAWGHGYATEAARVAIDDIFARVGLPEVLSYTAPDNVRSQAVMERLQLERDPARDFVANYPSVGAWHGLVWVANRQTQIAPRAT
jgi:RimJ/RimL family protein N-acetyltransferase